MIRRDNEIVNVTQRHNKFVNMINIENKFVDLIKWEIWGVFLNKEKQGHLEQDKQIGAKYWEERVNDK